ncbi:uncharacterized protein LOC132800053 [Ziziphus jujuba]|uniref:Uncharacterized protein LOC132800053 n=1 Tax=Ziziphus jujuba TaxID=326968 RepID=A0ABM3ZWT3_ZIZJJ|nr:uncharacterized protein LOC132800053 [Ziziphus jujuba]
MVDSLILPDGQWNKPVIERLFDKDSSETILQIYWADNNQEDMVVWTGSHSRTFHVKSTYKFINPVSGVSSNWWQFLWKSKIHDRLKYFMWKLASKGLTLRATLQSCNWEINNAGCPHGQETNFRRGSQALFSRFEEHKKLLSINSVHRLNSSSRKVVTNSWSRPLHGFIKVNCDASVKDNSAGIGVVMRNHEGEVIMLKSFTINLGFPEAAEADGLLKPVQLAIEGGHPSICCESDAIIQSLNNPSSISCHWSTAGYMKKNLDLRSLFVLSHLLGYQEKLTG